MLSMNRPRTEYRALMYLYPFIRAKNGVLEYEPKGIAIHCSFEASEHTSYVSGAQGIVFKNLSIETDCAQMLKKNDKITYLNHEYIVTSVAIENNAVSGTEFTNKPASIIQHAELEG